MRALTIRILVSSPGGESGGGKCSLDPSMTSARSVKSSGAPPSTMRASPVTLRYGVGMSGCACLDRIVTATRGSRRIFGQVRADQFVPVRRGLQRYPHDRHLGAAVGVERDQCGIGAVADEGAGVVVEFHGFPSCRSSPQPVHDERRLDGACFALHPTKQLSDCCCSETRVFADRKYAEQSHLIASTGNRLPPQARPAGRSVHRTPPRVLREIPRTGIVLVMLVGRRLRRQPSHPGLPPSAARLLTVDAGSAPGVCPRADARTGAARSSRRG